MTDEELLLIGYYKIYIKAYTTGFNIFGISSLHCEFSAHPITANQKIQPNYVKSNVQNREPDKVGNLKVSAVGYYNRVQQHIGLPNYQRIKSMAIQKTLFGNNLMYKDVSKRDDYPAVADIDYSEQVFNRMEHGHLFAYKKPLHNTARGRQCSILN